MKVLTLNLPAMYADHHVVEVKRLLSELPGVEEVYASSAFYAARVTYDPARVNEEQINARLAEAGYLGELPIPTETGAAAVKSDGKAFFRHTAAYEQTRQVVSFAQDVGWSGRPLWPCPGLGVIPSMDEEE
jgi:copper chaperone CopZ